FADGGGGVPRPDRDPLRLPPGDDDGSAPSSTDPLSGSRGPGGGTAPDRCGARCVPDSGAGWRTRSRNSGTLCTCWNCPTFDRPTRIDEPSPNSPSRRASRIASVLPLTVCVCPVSSLYTMYQTSADPLADGRAVTPDGGRLWPVRSS